MRATVPDLSALQANVASVDVAQVTIGQVTVGQLKVNDAAIGIHAGRATLRNVVVTVTLRLDVVWNVHVGLPWPFDDIDVGGTDRLATVGIPFPFGDADVPSLANLDVNVAQLSASGVRTQIDPISDLRLAALVAEGIRATDVSAPVAGFTLSGLGLSALAVDGTAVPSATIRSAAIRRVTSAPAVLGALRMRGLALPSAAVDDIRSQNVDLPLTRAPIDVGPLDLGILEIGLRITPSAQMHIASLQLSGVTMSVAVGSIELRNVTVPFEATNLTLGEIGIETIVLPTIGVD